MKTHPHDEFFKYLFSLTGVAREFLSAFLPAELLACLDLDSLASDDTEYITPELAAVFSDKVFRCKLKNTGMEAEKALAAAIVVLLEHKSFAPLYPHFQWNEYRQRIWTTLVNNGEKPVLVLPIILYHGTEAWKKRDLADYFGLVPKAFEPYLGGFDYWLVDLSEYSDGHLLQLRLGFLAYGLLTMKHSQDKIYLRDQMKVIFEKGEEFLKTEEGRTFVETLFVYYVRIANLDAPIIKEKIMENMAQNAQADFLSSYDKIKLEGKLEQAIFFAKNLMAEFASMTDEQIFKLTGAPMEEVKKLRQKALRKKGK
jgi:predicted transposase/invertase (TIGR01784 family)